MDIILPILANWVSRESKLHHLNVDAYLSINVQTVEVSSNFQLDSGRRFSDFTMGNDIVTNLYQNGVLDSIENIFSYLDYSDTKNATQVSRNWHDILMDSEVNVWKGLWQRNIAHLQIWKSLYNRAVCRGDYCPQTDPAWSYKEACLLIGDSHQNLFGFDQESLPKKRIHYSLLENQTSMTILIGIDK